MLFAVGALLTWRIGIRTVGEPYARLGAGAFWVWSAYVVWKSTRAHGFYGAGSCSAWRSSCLRSVSRSRPTRRDLSLLGLALGLGWWATPQVFGRPPGRRLARLAASRPAPIRVVVIARRGRRLASLARRERQDDWYSLDTPPRGGSLVDSVHNLLVSTLPTALGARLPFTLEWVGGAVVGACLYAMSFYGDRLDARSPAHAARDQSCRCSSAFPVFYALSPYSWFNIEPRYLVLVGPLLALVVVAAGGTAGRSAAIACALALLSASESAY